MKQKQRISAFFSGLTLLAAVGSAGAQTAYTWNGTTNTTFATTTNWTAGSVAPTGGTSNSRLNVYNTDPAKPLTYTATQGTTIYSGGAGRSLVIASGIAGNMVINGGTFDSRQTLEDIMVNGQFAGSLTINGGNYINTNAGSDTFIVGFNGGASAGAVATLNIQSGNFTSGRVQFGQNAGMNSGGVVGIVDLDGGILSTKQFHEQAALGNFGDTGSTLITSTVNFNGGTLRALESGTIMKVNAVDNAVVKSGGAIINTNTFNTTIAKALTAGSPSGGLTKQGAGSLTLSAVNTYTGDTLVSAGTLFVTGSLTSNVTVSDAATTGGGGTVGAISFEGASFFDIFSAIGGNSLDSTSTISFSAGGFGVDNLVSNGAAVNWGTVNNGTYTLITGTLDNTNLGNFGLANAFDLGSGRSAYFQSGSLQLVVIPEPNVAALLGGLGMLALLRRRRN